MLGSLNVMQDMVGDILPGGIRQEVIIWLQSMVAILLYICMNVCLVISTPHERDLHEQSRGPQQQSDVKGYKRGKHTQQGLA